MSVSRTLANWLMLLAARIAPADRADWSLAMRREFDTLERGAFGWALGCLATATGWMLRAQWLYLLLLALPPFYEYALTEFQFGLLADGYVSQQAFREFMINYATVQGLLLPLPVALIAGAYRPKQIAATIVVGCLLFYHVGTTFYLCYTLGGSFLSWWGPGATVYMLPAWLGLIASLWVWFFGAYMGAWLRRRRSRA